MSDLSEQLGIATDRRPNGAVVIRLAGSLDAAGSEALIGETAQLDAHRGDDVVVRLDEVTCVDAAGIGALFYLEAFVRARGGRFILAAPPPHVGPILAAAGLGRHVRPSDDGAATIEASRGTRRYIDRAAHQQAPRQ
jgi:anti-anti-sigma factor